MLTLRKPSTLFILTLLDEVLQPLARLSKCLQSSDGNISTAMSIANAVIASIEEINLEKIRNMAIETEKKVTTAGARMINNDDLPIKEQIKVCQNYINSIVTNLRLRFSDEVSSLCILEEILNKKPINPIFDKISSLLHVDSKELHSEWQILRRLPGNLNTQEAMMDLALSNDRQQMFPYFSAACRKILLLPLGTASVERSFSTMNRIMTSKRCRLNPDHLSQLMLLSIEGPDIPDIRDNDNSECAKFCELIDAAYSIWLNKPRRGFTNV